jgi:hypothetical protein
MRSWASILANPNSPPVVCQDTRTVVFGDCAMVVCFEAVPGGFLIATNLFVRHGHLWKLVHHQAGPTNAQPEAEPGEEEGPPRPN